RQRMMYFSCCIISAPPENVKRKFSFFCGRSRAGEMRSPAFSPLFARIHADDLTDVPGVGSLLLRLDALGFVVVGKMGCLGAAVHTCHIAAPAALVLHAPHALPAGGTVLELVQCFLTFHV